MGKGIKKNKQKQLFSLLFLSNWLNRLFFIYYILMQGDLCDEDEEKYGIIAVQQNST